MSVLKTYSVAGAIHDELGRIWKVAIATYLRK